MTSPFDPPAEAAVQSQLSEQAAAASVPSAVPAVDLSAAQAAVADANALLARIQELEKRQQAAEDAANPPPQPPDDSIVADGNAPGWLHAAFAKIEKRLSALEG